jgi:hypothetical protein
MLLCAVLGKSGHIDRLQQGINVSVCLDRRGMRLAGLHGRPEVGPGDVKVSLTHPDRRMAQQARHGHEVCPAA